MCLDHIVSPEQAVSSVTKQRSCTGSVLVQAVLNFTKGCWKWIAGLYLAARKYREETRRNLPDSFCSCRNAQCLDQGERKWIVKESPCCPLYNSLRLERKSKGSWKGAGQNMHTSRSPSQCKRHESYRKFEEICRKLQEKGKTKTLYASKRCWQGWLPLLSCEICHVVLYQNVSMYFTFISTRQESVSHCWKTFWDNTVELILPYWWYYSSQKLQCTMFEGGKQHWRAHFRKKSIRLVPEKVRSFKLYSKRRR